jgi:aminodeoxyfutalosine deaminase
MTIDDFISAMPKVELHVHLEGSIRPQTLLRLAAQNKVSLPARTVEDLQAWYRFTDFPHFIDVYATMVSCIRGPDDIELITREFLLGQKAQNVLHSEVTYTPFPIYRDRQISFSEQLAAINRAKTWAEKELGISMSLTIDMPREQVSEAESLMIADWAIRGLGQGVTGFGLGGPEAGYPPHLFKKTFTRAREAGLASVPHAGETAGAESIWGALRDLGADRIGHGVRCLEDDSLVGELRDRRIPLEVCPTSNVCLRVCSDIASHPLPRLIDQDLFVTINSDDPPMFNTSLTNEYRAIAEVFHLDQDTIEQLAWNGLRASILPKAKRQNLEQQFHAQFEHLPTQQVKRTDIG